MQNVSQYIKRARRDLNPRPTEPESVALSTELRALTLKYYIILIQSLNIQDSRQLLPPAPNSGGEENSIESSPRIGGFRGLIFSPPRIGGFRGLIFSPPELGNLGGLSSVPQNWGI